MNNIAVPAVYLCVCIAASCTNPKSAPKKLESLNQDPSNRIALNKEFIGKEILYQRVIEIAGEGTSKWGTKPDMTASILDIQVDQDILTLSSEGSDIRKIEYVKAGSNYMIDGSQLIPSIRVLEPKTDQDGKIIFRDDGKIPVEFNSVEYGVDVLESDSTYNPESSSLLIVQAVDLHTDAEGVFSQSPWVKYVHHHFSIRKRSATLPGPKILGKDNRRFNTTEKGFVQRWNLKSTPREFRLRGDMPDAAIEGTIAAINYWNRVFGKEVIILNQDKNTDISLNNFEHNYVHWMDEPLFGAGENSIRIESTGEIVSGIELQIPSEMFDRVDQSDLKFHVAFIVAHELGHSFGLAHNSYYDLKSNLPINSVMGYPHLIGPEYTTLVGKLLFEKTLVFDQKAIDFIYYGQELAPLMEEGFSENFKKQRAKPAPKSRKDG